MSRRLKRTTRFAIDSSDGATDRSGTRPREAERRFGMLLLLGAAITLLVVLVFQMPREARGQVTARLPKCDGLEATIVGTAGNDVLRGTQGPDVIVALGGHDDIFGHGSDDLICAGGGHDWLEGGGGDDVLRGEAGRDALGAPPEDEGGIPTGTPAAFPPGVTVIGDAGDDIMLGGPGDDLLRGGGGDDMLFGEEGNDELGCCGLHGEYGYYYGDFDNGNDSMDGGEGEDHCTDFAGDNSDTAEQSTCEKGAST